MQKGWKALTIGDVAEITDYVANGSFATLRENVSYKSTKDYAILVRLADYSSGFDESKFVYIDKHSYDFLAKSKLYGGEIIMSNVGSIGKLFICPDLGMPMSLAPNSIVIKTAFNRFYFYLFQSRHYQDLIQSITSTTALPKFNKTSFKKIPIQVPPYPEQERIVAELDLLSSVLDKQKALLKELDTLANSVFYDMFGNPDTNNRNWTVKKLGELCDSELGKTLNQSKDRGSLRPYLCAVNIHWNEVDLSTLKETKFEDSELDRYSVRQGDLLVCEGGDIGRSAIWKKNETIQYQNALHRIRFRGEMVPVFCLYVLQFLKQQGILDGKYGKGVTIKHLVKSSLLSIPMPVPPLLLQLDFAKRIENIEQQKALITRSITETTKLFDFTMNKYFG